MTTTLTDAERIAAAEALARGGETAQAVALLLALVRDFTSKPHIRYADRRAALELLATLAPDDVDVACALARLLRPDDATAALAAMQSALRSPRRSLHVLRVLADVQHACGDVPRAVEAYAELRNACRLAMATGDGTLSERQKLLMTELGVYLKYRLYEKAEEFLVRSGMLEGDVLDAELHLVAAEVARELNRPHDRGAEHEIFGLILTAASRGETGRLFDAARGRYPELTLFVALEERLRRP